MPGLFTAWDARRDSAAHHRVDPVAGVQVDGDRAERYARATLASACRELVAVPVGDGRNDQLNRAALRCYRLHAAAGLPPSEVTEALGAADGGLDHPATARTLQSAREAAQTQGPATMPSNKQTDDPFGEGDYTGRVHTLPPRMTAPAESIALAAGDASTWAAVDLGSILDGTRRTVVADLMPRTDGVHLLYPGAVHSFHGESESGKSLVLQCVAVNLITAGDRVLFVDFESDPASIVDRLRTLGATDDAIRERFTYVQPEARPDGSRIDAAAWAALLGGRYRLAVIDGVTDALSVFGYGTKENDDVTAWMRAMPKTIAARTGAAVALVDHVTKDSEGRGRFAIGGQAKMASLTGAAYTVSVAEPLGRDTRGVIVLRIGKDRPGTIRPHCGPFRKSDRTQEAARVIIDDTGDGPTRWTIEPWSQPGTSTAGHGFRPTFYMERVCRYVEDNPEATTNDVTGNVTGDDKVIRQALALLVNEGHLTVTDGERRSKLHTLARSYRQATDPASDVSDSHRSRTDSTAVEVA